MVFIKTCNLRYKHKIPMKPESMRESRCYSPFSFVLTLVMLSEPVAITSTLQSARLWVQTEFFSELQRTQAFSAPLCPQSKHLTPACSITTTTCNYCSFRIKMANYNHIPLNICIENSHNASFTIILIKLWLIIGSFNKSSE